MKIQKIVFVCILLFTITIAPILAQINDPHALPDAQTSIIIPWATMGIVSSIVIVFAIHRHREGYPLSTIFKYNNDKPRVQLNIKQTTSIPNEQPIELNESAPEMRTQ